mmetsp:Transcript_2403/g.6465  ORF Transcript_2403/g.6465 Transcript_2403/m.6465 type:complete len:94 (-) Transcript_2403:199-480(-)
MYRPACRQSQTGVRSVTSPRAARTRMSRSPGSVQWECSVTISSTYSIVDAASDDDDDDDVAVVIPTTDEGANAVACEADASNNTSDENFMVLL